MGAQLGFTSKTNHKCAKLARRSHLMSSQRGFLCRVDPAFRNSQEIRETGKSGKCLDPCDKFCCE